MNPFRTDNDLGVVLFDLEAETARIRLRAAYLAVAAEPSTDMSVAAMEPARVGISVAADRQRREYRPRGSKQAAYAMRGRS